jgi:hypothetical protein
VARISSRSSSVKSTNAQTRGVETSEMPRASGVYLNQRPGQAQS